MEIQPNRAIVPSGNVFVRWGLRGGALAAMAPMVNYVALNISPQATAGVIGTGAVAGAVVPIIVALLLRRRQGFLKPIERELQRARDLMERQLIDEDDYRRLKSQILETYRPGPLPALRLWPIVLWGACVGITVVSGFVAWSAGEYWLVPIAGIAALIGGAVTGGAAQAYAAISGSAARARLPGPKDRRLLE